MDYWVDPAGKNAIWYIQVGSTYAWMIGFLLDLGSIVRDMNTESDVLQKKCPNN